MNGRASIVNPSWPLVPFASVALLFTLLACGQPVKEAAEERGKHYSCQGCNVVLVSIDTLRADRMSVYGYSRPTTPFLDELAGEAVVFEDFVHSGGGTLPSHMTMFTSLYPGTHQVDVHTGKSLEEERTTLAEVLKEHGYATGAFTDGGWMSGKFGFSQGFDIFDDRDVHGHLKVNQPKAHRWIRRHQKEPFFVFLHTYDIHSQTRKLPYECPDNYHNLYTGNYAGEFDGCIGDRCASKLLAWLNEGAQRGDFAIEAHLSPRDLEYISSLYDGCINYVDGKLAELVNHLKELDLYDDTLIVVTSDHGEEFLDHGLLIHHQGGYEEMIHIPFILKLPKSSAPGKRVSQVATMVDVVPTILDILDLPIPEQAQGRSLMPAVIGDDRIRKAAHIHNVLRTDRWKYFSDDGRLFDLDQDPDETKDVAANHPDLVRRLDRHVRELMREDLRSRERLERGEQSEEPEASLTADEIEHLKALGYLN